MTAIQKLRGDEAALGKRHMLIGGKWVDSAHRARKLLDPRFERIGNPGEKSPALARDHARPAWKGIGRSFHGTLDILGPTSWDLGDRAPVRRVLDLEHLARSAVDPLATDQHVPFAKRRLVSAQFLDSRHAHLHRSGPARGSTTAL